MKSMADARLADFSARINEDRDAGFEVPGLGAYVAVHPTADDVALLKRLDLSPRSCTKVDCYWKPDGDVYFLQIETSGYANREPGLWGRLSAGDPSYVNLVGVIADDFVTRAVLHEMMRQFLVRLDNLPPLSSTLRRIDSK